MTDRINLEQISSRAWEHPADRVALNTLRALPGFDEVVRKVASAMGERAVRHIFLANAVRVGPRQRPKLDAMLTEVLETLDWAPRPQLYVTQSPFLNAAAVGFGAPFIVINSEALKVLNDDEKQFLIAHEVGHIMSGHTTYRTLAVILLTVGLRGLPPLAALGLMPFQLALLEWYRKSEMSSDRAAMLGIQDRMVAMGTLMKLAGGEPTDDESSVDEFMAQAAEYEVDESAWDTALKMLVTAFREHPFATVRAAELQRWMDRGEYQEILNGNYVRRSAERDQPLSDDFADASGYYGPRARQAWGQVENVLDRAVVAFSDALREAGVGDMRDAWRGSWGGGAGAAGGGSAGGGDEGDGSPGVPGHEPQEGPDAPPPGESAGPSPDSR